MGRVGNDDRSIRKFLRENKVKPTLENIERVQRECKRTAAENERVEREWKERGGDDHVRDARGVVGPRIKRRVEDELARRNQRRR